MPTTITVGTLDELYAVLATVQGGETILLEGGSYGDLYIGPRSPYDVDFPETVTIASADLEDPAVFSTLSLGYVSNLTLDGLVFDYTYAVGDLPWDLIFAVGGSDNITIRNSTFDGDVASDFSSDPSVNGYGFGKGLSVRDTNGFTAENNTFFGFATGFVAHDCQQVAVTGNDVHSMRKDGINFVGVQDVLIEDNHIHDFIGREGADDHRDMIQFWTRDATTPSTDIVIRGNHLDIGEGDWTQSIFMANEEVDGGRAGEEMFYQNVLIEENVIVNAHLHGITVGETDGLTIRNNTVVQNPLFEAPQDNPSLWTPRIGIAPDSRNVQILRNVTSAIVGQGRMSAWDIRDNLMVQYRNPRLAFHYSDVFGPTALEDPTRIDSFAARPGGPLDGTGIGASRLAMPRPEMSDR
jgi:parallel beta-helix repeat protein